MFKTVLIANRGEIAVRIIAACQEMGIRAVAVYSDVDRDALHVRRADDARRLGPAPAAESYLNISALLAAARSAEAEAIHPGYGFLSENAAFAQACLDAGIVFIGPPPEAIRLMGSKIAAKRAVEAAGVPTVPGYAGAARDGRALLREAQRIGFPVMIKAAAGGGGKGMRVVTAAEDFIEALEAARREARAAFGDDSVFLEKLLVAPRHVEFQVLADAHGTVLHLGERECSIQRRHQKVIEESPCPVLSDRLRAEMGAAAVAAARAAGYINAGTCEFLLDADQRYYFLEMNTRLQVEHPITEAVTGLDLVHLQLRIAAGERLNLAQHQVAPRGHAIEARLYAEDPTNAYLPSTGTIVDFAPPSAPGIRVDAGVATGDAVSMYYDPMLAKLIVSAPDRAAAIARLRWALDRFAVLGVTTNLPLLRAVAYDSEFALAHTHTDFLIIRGLVQIATPSDPPDAVFVAAALFEAEANTEHTAPNGATFNPWSHARFAEAGSRRHLHYIGNRRKAVVTLTPGLGRPHAYVVQVDGRQYPMPEAAPVFALRAATHEFHLYAGNQVEHFAVAREATRLLIAWCGQTYTLDKPHPPDVDSAARIGESAATDQRLVAPMAGTIIKVHVAPGQRVQAHQTLLVLGAMKMEHAVTAPYAGRVRAIAHRVGEVVPGGATLIDLEATADAR